MRMPGADLVRNGKCQAPAPHGWRQRGRGHGAPGRKRGVPVPRRMSSATRGKGQTCTAQAARRTGCRSQGESTAPRTRGPRRKGRVNGFKSSSAKSRGVDVILLWCSSPRGCGSDRRPTFCRCRRRRSTSVRALSGSRLGVGAAPQPVGGNGDEATRRQGPSRSAAQRWSRQITGVGVPSLIWSGVGLLERCRPAG